MSDPQPPETDLSLSGTIFIPQAKVLPVEAGQDVHPIHLEVVGGPMDGLRMWSAKSPVTVGRGEENDLELGCDKRVSGRHAQIVREGKSFFLEDLGSRNGTLVGGHRIEARVPISPGATFQVGGTSIEFTAQ